MRERGGGLVNSTHDATAARLARTTSRRRGGMPSLRARTATPDGAHEPPQVAAPGVGNVHEEANALAPRRPRRRACSALPGSRTGGTRPPGLDVLQARLHSCLEPVASLAWSNVVLRASVSSSSRHAAPPSQLPVLGARDLRLLQVHGDCCRPSWRGRRRSPCNCGAAPARVRPGARSARAAGTRTRRRSTPHGTKGARAPVQHEGKEQAAVRVGTAGAAWATTPAGRGTGATGEAGGPSPPRGAPHEGHRHCASREVGKGRRGHRRGQGGGPWGRRHGGGGGGVARQARHVLDADGVRVRPGPPGTADKVLEVGSAAGRGDGGDQGDEGGAWGVEHEADEARPAGDGGDEVLRGGTAFPPANVERRGGGWSCPVSGCAAACTRRASTP